MLHKHPPTNLHTHACKAKSTTQQIGTNNNSNKTTHKDDEQQNTKATRKYLSKNCILKYIVCVFSSHPETHSIPI